MKIILSVPNEDYSRNASYILNLVSKYREKKVAIFLDLCVVHY